jgi:hypothetical protein
LAAPVWIVVATARAAVATPPAASWVSAAVVVVRATAAPRVWTWLPGCGPDLARTLENTAPSTAATSATPATDTKTRPRRLRRRPTTPFPPTRGVERRPRTADELDAAPLAPACYGSVCPPALCLLTYIAY